MIMIDFLFNFTSFCVIVSIFDKSTNACYIIFNIIKSSNTQPARDVLEKCPEGLLKVLTSVTSGRPSGDSQGTNTKIDDRMKRLCFRLNSPCFKYLFLFFFTEKKNIQKF